ncbi:MAG: T9SS type A sorting domain-containing protein [Fibrobacteres bacterium]|nr:T9SS type A sorting domain-containing protein [Fibrobacterota bacterium]
MSVRSKSSILLIILSFCYTAFSGVVTFTKQPALIPNGSGYNAEFELSALTDVEVSIIKESTKEVVRHLASGVLGPNSPYPLQKNSTAQTIYWDGTDDFGVAVINAASCKLRVRAGMTPELDTMIGESPYAFHRTINGITAGSDGKMYVYGSYPRPSHHGTTMMTVRRYSAAGTYEKTLWPVPAGLPINSVQPLNVLATANGYLPRSQAGDVPQFGGSPLAYEESAMLSQLVNNAAFIYDMREYRYLLLNGDGSVLDTGRIIKQPALPLTNQYNGPWPTGCGYLTMSPDQKYFLLSGYRASNYDTTKKVWWPSDTGFWREGQVYKVDFATGTASSFISIPLDSLPKTVDQYRATIGPFYTSASISFMSSFHGTAFDNQGRVYVCDRLRREVGVYDTNGIKVSALPVVDPDVVAVSSRTGAVYVLSRQYTAYQIGTSKLTKFKAYNDTNRTVVAKVFTGTPAYTPIVNDKSLMEQSCSHECLYTNPAIRAKTAAVEDERKGPVAFLTKLSLCLQETGTTTKIWVNSLNGSNAFSDSSLSSIRAFEDNGTSINKVIDFWNNTRGISTGYDRVAVDRKTETVFINDSWNTLSKISNWSNPTPVRCRTTSGTFLDAADMTVSPDGKYLYISKWTYPEHPILRYSLDSLHAPVNFAAKGTNIAVAGVKQRYGAGVSDRGIAVTPKGLIYAITSQDTLLIFDTTGARVNDTLLKSQVSIGGIRADLKGNLYVGMLLRSPSHVIPSEFQSYKAYTAGTGAVVKMRLDTQVTVATNSNLTLRVPLGASKVYSQPISPFSNAYTADYRVPSSSASCVCRRPRHDVDAYGRIFMPHTVTAQIFVSDNEGNTITSFGTYGNVDSKGAGSTIPVNGIPFAWPTGIAASEDYMYITDMVNARLVRVRMAYALDNVPGFTSQRHGSPSFAKGPALSIFPNPFNPASELSVSLPSQENVTITVFSADGKFIKELKRGAMNRGETKIVWDGNDSKGMHASAGIYLFKLKTKTKTVSIKGILAR